MHYVLQFYKGGDVTEERKLEPSGEDVPYTDVGKLIFDHLGEFDYVRLYRVEVKEKEKVMQWSRESLL